jgi:CDP-diacylglycerol--serine O-phosphatidyltransferase
MSKPFAFLPNLITLLNLSAGSVALVFALEGDLGTAALLIFLAAVFDFLDGFMARLLKAYSDIGRELDSLADVVSFGVAPGMIAFTLMKIALFGENLPLSSIRGSFIDWLFLVVILLIPALSAYRLAKFNTDTRQTVNFLGLPTPANAILWASFGIMTGYSSNAELLEILFTPWNLAITALVMSLLLVSEIPMFSLKFSGISLKENWFRYILLLFALVLFIISPVYAPVLVILFYIAFSLSFYILNISF